MAYYKVVIEVIIEAESLQEAELVVDDRLDRAFDEWYSFTMVLVTA